MGTKKIVLDVITDYNQLDTVIAKLIELRKEYGVIDAEVYYPPYDETPRVEVTLIVKEDVTIA